MSLSSFFYAQGFVLISRGASCQMSECHMHCHVVYQNIYMYIVQAGPYLTVILALLLPYLTLFIPSSVFRFFLRRSSAIEKGIQIFGNTWDFVPTRGGV